MGVNLMKGPCTTYTTTSSNNKGTIQTPVRFEQGHRMTRHLCPSRELMKWRADDVVVEHILAFPNRLAEEAH
jgi:hypothetical protein